MGRPRADRLDSADLTDRELARGTFLTVKQAADRLGFTPGWIREQCRVGTLAHTKPDGHRIRIPLAAFEAFAARNMVRRDRVA